MVCRYTSHTSKSYLRLEHHVSNEWYLTFSIHFFITFHMRIPLIFCRWIDSCCDFQHRFPLAYSIHLCFDRFIFIILSAINLVLILNVLSFPDGIFDQMVHHLVITWNYLHRTSLVTQNHQTGILFNKNIHPTPRKIAVTWISPKSLVPLTLVALTWFPIRIFSSSCFQ